MQAPWFAASSSEGTIQMQTKLTADKPSSYNRVPGRNNDAGLKIMTKYNWRQ